MWLKNSETLKECCFATIEHQTGMFWHGKCANFPKSELDFSSCDCNSKLETFPHWDKSTVLDVAFGTVLPWSRWKQRNTWVCNLFNAIEKESLAKILWRQVLHAQWNTKDVNLCCLLNISDRMLEFVPQCSFHLILFLSWLFFLLLCGCRRTRDVAQSGFEAASRKECDTRPFKHLTWEFYSWFEVKVCPRKGKKPLACFTPKTHYLYTNDLRLEINLHIPETVFSLSLTRMYGQRWMNLRFNRSCHVSAHLRTLLSRSSFGSLLGSLVP